MKVKNGIRDAQVVSGSSNASQLTPPLSHSMRASTIQGTVVIRDVGTGVASIVVGAGVSSAALGAKLGADEGAELGAADGDELGAKDGAKDGDALG